MQKRRFAADYDPGPAGEFNLPHVLYLIDECELTMQRFSLVSPDDRKAFAVLVMLKSRNR